MSSTSWDHRYRQLAAHTRAEPNFETINAPDLVPGDQLRWGGTTFEITDCQTDGVIVEVHAANDTRVIDIDYLAIERVEVASPRPATRKANT